VKYVNIMLVVIQNIALNVTGISQKYNFKYKILDYEYIFRCVNGFDHHNYLINNCIGRKNFNFYI
jgi:hypothetical protein